MFFDWILFLFFDSCFRSFGPFLRFLHRFLLLVGLHCDFSFVVKPLYSWPLRAHDMNDSDGFYGVPVLRDDHFSS